MNPNRFSTLSRRDFLHTAGGIGAGAVLGFPTARTVAEEVKASHPRGQAEHCIFIWLGGGASHIDMWDPKRLGDGKKIAGSAYPAIDTAIPGVQVTEHLTNCAKVFDRFVVVRTVHHDVIDEHAAATNRVHTGRPTSGTAVFPSIGSIVAHERGAAAEGVPAYLVMGYPNVTRGPGFLGSRYGYIYLLGTEAGPSGLRRPGDLTPQRTERREELLTKLRSGYVEKHRDDRKITDYDAAIGESFKLAKGDFMRAFELGREPATLRQEYGSEFGQRCLLARRLVQSGVRFIEVSFNLNFLNGTGWDTHLGGHKNQHLLIRDLDQSLATLVMDLERHRLLDKTLIVVATEFGRPAEFDGGGGRGHWAKAFSVVLAGGGLRTGQSVGVTDELGMKIEDTPVSVPDLHATIHCALGINPAKTLRDELDRPVPITDRGEPVRKLFS
ncbi:MAG: DUF1501 domain-containing protein [Pedosphaera sp.]|nr:DUF1501 domain-containing protein [Pedosphaera sp.]